jgi:hypothetical protein
MLGPFFHAPSADEKGTKLAWSVARPALLFVVEGIEMSGCMVRRSCDSQLTPTNSGRGAEGLPVPVI